MHLQSKLFSHLNSWILSRELFWKANNWLTNTWGKKKIRQNIRNGINGYLSIVNSSSFWIEHSNVNGIILFFSSPRALSLFHSSFLWPILHECDKCRGHRNILNVIGMKQKFLREMPPENIHDLFLFETCRKKIN